MSAPDGITWNLFESHPDVTKAINRESAVLAYRGTEPPAHYESDHRYWTWRLGIKLSLLREKTAFVVLETKDDCLKILTVEETGRMGWIGSPDWLRNLDCHFVLLVGNG